MRQLSALVVAASRSLSPGEDKRIQELLELTVSAAHILTPHKRDENTAVEGLGLVYDF